MNINTLFIDWLHEQEWLDFFASILTENELTAAMDSNNRELNPLIGTTYNWYGLVIQQCKRYVSGQDIMLVANDVINHLMKSLKNPANKLYQNLAQLKQLQVPDQDQQVIKLISQAIAIRARRFSDSFRTNAAKMTVRMSELPASHVGNIENPAKQANFGDLESLKQAVVDELEKMAAAANDQRTMKRLQTAAKVAPIRMQNAPHMMPIDDLIHVYNRQYGEEIKRGTMNNIIQDIQAAFTRVAEKFGMNTISMAIDKYQQRKAI